jgi:hypothetical protein
MRLEKKGRAKVGGIHAEGPMTLAAKNWLPISIDEVVLAWQRAERHWFSNDPHSTAHLDAFLNSPDLEDADQNRERRRLLDLIREPLLRWIPADTEWYRVDSLTEFGELRAIFSAPWTDLARDRNELLLVGRRRNLALTSDPASWDMPILWGHQKQGPFTIIEGNKRLAACADSGKALNIVVLVGLSSLTCRWHLPDRVG